MPFTIFNKKKGKFVKKSKIFDNKNFLNFTLIILIFFVFSQEFHVFKNTHDLITKDYYNRATKAYNKTFFSGYCEGSSHGYLFYIKNRYSEKFGENKIPKIINNFNKKKEYWVFSNVNAKINSQQIIILNKIEDIDLDNYHIIDNNNNKCFFVEKK